MDEQNLRRLEQAGSALCDTIQALRKAWQACPEQSPIAESLRDLEADAQGLAREIARKLNDAPPPPPIQP